MTLHMFSSVCWLSVYLWRNVSSNSLFIFKLSYLSFCCWVISSLYILDTRPFLNIWFAVVFKLMGYLSLFLTVAFEEQKILFWWSQLPFIFLWLHVLSVSCLKSQCFIQGPKALYLRFSLRFYSFSHYI